MNTYKANNTPEGRTMKEKVIKILLKGGFNPATVDKMIAKHFDYAVSTYPNAKPRFIADVVRTLD